MLRRIYCKIITIAVLGISTGSYASTTGFIDTPDLCAVVSNLNGTDIYLSKTGKCDGKPGRAYVPIKPGEHRKVFIDGVFWQDREVRPLEVVDVTSTLDKAERDAKTISTQNQHADAMTKEAQKTAAYLGSKQFQARLETEKGRVIESLPVDLKAYYPQLEAATKGSEDIQGNGLLGEKERVYIFVSSSMSRQALRNYISDAEKLGDGRVTIVMRGFIGGMEKIIPTLKFIANMAKKNPSCEITEEKPCEMRKANIIIDPMLFRRYGVQVVPTIVYAKGIDFTDPGKSEGDVNHIKAEGDVYKIAGDISLKYALGKFVDTDKSLNSLESVRKRL